MAFGGDRVPDFFNFAVDADQKCATDYAFENPAHEFFGAPDAVSLNHFVRGIAEQRKIEFLLVTKVGQQSLRIGAGAQDSCVFLVKTSFCVTKLGRFGGSTGSVGFGKEKEHHAFAFEIAQTNINACVVWQGKVRGLVSDFQHRSFPDGSGVKPLLQN